MTNPLAIVSEPVCPRIYIACLASYNAGILHGAWIDATTPDEVKVEVQHMLAASPVLDASEYALHDYEGFEGCDLAEFTSFETVCELAGFIIEHGTLGAKLYRHFGNDLTEARRAFEDYAGSYPSAADFAEEIMRDCGTEIPHSLRYYVDWDTLARDMVLNGEILIVEMRFDEVHIFWSH